MISINGKRLDSVTPEQIKKIILDSAMANGRKLFVVRMNGEPISSNQIPDPIPDGTTFWTSFPVVNAIVLNVVLANPQEYRQKNSITRTLELPKRIPRTREQILDMLGRKCCRCGYDADVRALQIDHINGGGRGERKKLRGYDRYYKHILANPAGYQILCANCNCIKMYEEDEISQRYQVE